MGKKRYYFDYPRQLRLLPEHSAHRGQLVEVVRRLRRDEYDFEGDAAFLIRARDGWEGFAWRSELKLVR